MMNEHDIELDAIEVGDRITFRAPNRHTGGAKATRVVKEAHSDYFTVTFVGWANFVVQAHEVTGHNPREVTQ